MNNTPLILLMLSLSIGAARAGTDFLDASTLADQRLVAMHTSSTGYDGTATLPFQPIVDGYGDAAFAVGDRTYYPSGTPEC